LQKEKSEIPENVDFNWQRRKEDIMNLDHESMMKLIREDTGMLHKK